MTDTELLDLLRARFGEGFADATATRVVAADAVEALYRAATAGYATLPQPERHRLLFRGAYVLERIYFASRARFEPFVDDFCRRGFPECRDASARRSFGKIMSDLLDRTCPDAQTLERIAETAAEWAVDPQSKVAVRVWAVEVLKRCRDGVAWVSEVWDDVVETQARDATPGIASRLRSSWQGTMSERKDKMRKKRC